MTRTVSDSITEIKIAQQNYKLSFRQDSSAWILFTLKPYLAVLSSAELSGECKRDSAK